MQLETGTSLRWIRAIWLTALLAAFGLPAVVSVSAFASAPLSFGYDGQNQPRVAYDEALLPAFNYDRAAFRHANVSENGTGETGGTFATFCNFLAADGTASLIHES